MKKAIVLLFSLLFLFVGCDKKDTIPTCESCNFTCLDQTEPNIYTNDCPINWECSFKVMEQSIVDLEKTKGVSNGDKTVFQMFRHTEGDTGIADDELSNILVFELDESQNSFSVEDAELAEMNVHFVSICYCPDANFRPITNGCLQGEKQTDGTWFVQAYFGDTFEFGINAQFKN